MTAMTTETQTRAIKNDSAANVLPICLLAPMKTASVNQLFCLLQALRGAVQCFGRFG
jgi:hypothetical protein